MSSSGADAKQQVKIADVSVRVHGEPERMRIFRVKYIRPPERGGEIEILKCVVGSNNYSDAFTLDRAVAEQLADTLDDWLAT